MSPFKVRYPKPAAPSDTDSGRKAAPVTTEVPATTLETAMYRSLIYKKLSQQAIQGSESVFASRLKGRSSAVLPVPRL